MNSEQIKAELTEALAAVAKAQALLATARAHLSSITDQARPTQRRVDECYDVTKMESQHLDAVLEQIAKAIQFVG